MTDQVAKAYWETLAARYRDSQLSLAAEQGANLAALRRGLGKPAGSVPEMWRFYTTLRDEPSQEPHPRLVAEHATLTVFGLHQQGQDKPMHRAGVHLGRAMSVLRNASIKQGGGEDAAASLDRRFAAAATALSMNEAVEHIRRLVTLLRREGQPLDYTALCTSLRWWHDPQSRARTRRHWASGYFTTQKPGDDPGARVQPSASGKNSNSQSI